jgi:hypothetical protein
MSRYEVPTFSIVTARFLAPEVVPEGSTRRVGMRLAASAVSSRATCTKFGERDSIGSSSGSKTPKSPVMTRSMSSIRLSRSW